MGQSQLPRIYKFIILFSINIVVIIALLYGFEFFLKFTDPARKLPFDTIYYTFYHKYYQDVEIPKNDIYTWGHLVINNRLGFRERDFTVPKPPGICRIMVLGDSLTWGAGLAVTERYTDLVENELNGTFPDRKFEVLNFGLPGAPTIFEEDVLRDFKDLVNPDLIVIGFVTNDPQPKGESYTIERERFDQRYGDLLNTISQTLIQIGLPQTAKMSQKAIDNFIVKVGIVPDWSVGLQRTYEKNSTEWFAFRQSLRGIKTMSDELGLPPPVFAVLNQGIYLDHSTDYRDQNETLPIYLRWYHQAEQAAAEIGFKTYNHEKEFINHLSPEEIPVNRLDRHPSAKVDRIYAQKLFDTIAPDIRTEQLCNPASLDQGSTLGTLSLTGRRLMSVRVGEQLRFLGYTADNLDFKEGHRLFLSFGWQALTKIEKDYVIFIHLLDNNGYRWAQSDASPCGGHCPTSYWPVGAVTTPQNVSIIHWSSITDRNEWIEIKKPVNSYLDEHEVVINSSIPPGEYNLVMGMYNPDTGERLPAYDEITELWLPKAQIILGKVKIH